MRDGVVTEQGSLDELMAHNGPFAQFLSQFLSQQQQHQQKGEGRSNSDRAQGDVDTGDERSTSSLDKELEDGKYSLSL